MGILRGVITAAAITSPTHPKETHFTDFGDLLGGKRVMAVI
jgi:hypothetical protein